MKWNKEKTSILLCCLLIAFALIAPSFIRRETARDRYGEWLQPTQPVWQGQLTLWTVVGFPVGEGTLGGWVRAQVRAFEKSAFGVYVDVRVMTPEEAKAALDGGEKPDVLVFPSGFLDAPEGLLTPLSDPIGINGALLASAERGGTLYALPVMAGAYLLCVNEERGMAAGTEPPDGIGYPPKTVAEMAAGDDGGLCVDGGPYVSPGLAFAYALDGGDTEIIRALKGAGDAGAFKDGDALLCLGSQNTAGAVQDAYENGNGFGSTAWAVSGFTDMVQYVGVTDGLPEAREQMCFQLAGSFVSQSAQESLKDIGMFAAAEGLEPLYEDDPRFYASEQQLSREMAVPPAFGYSALRGGWEERLNKAVQGDAAALRSLVAAMRAACKQG
jgi:maltose-binding protein MalE